MQYYIEGLVAGFALSFLLGPLFFMLIRIGIEYGFRATMIYCAGVWVSDLFYILFTYFGISYVVALTKITGFEFYTGLIGGGLLIAFGLGSIFLQPPQISNERLIVERVSSLSLFIKGFFINTFNPFTVFFWIILSGKLSIESGITHTNATTFYAGLYTMLISTDALKAILAKKIQQKITPRLLLNIRKILGLILVVFGVVLIARVTLHTFYPDFKI